MIIIKEELKDEKIIAEMISENMLEVKIPEQVKEKAKNNKTLQKFFKVVRDKEFINSFIARGGRDVIKLEKILDVTFA